ncbi:dephospho-CoA kinase [Anaeromicropila herbilytica]|uniref:Dephospho-CoA kinase n=1 Tax=Anaeromicropila herbilytica TaxID=2785025 RepID=A0A7R7EKN4_9FIRM|nr:dephospho-CoA kinase [Anaeromicropila herbilytica]BCN30534.1 dephospho-CoA kinase [Anaeromicropila herbilytica]
MKIIGLTGGVGSGKSTVAKLMGEHYRAHLLIADDIARDFMKKGNVSFHHIVDYFGVNILDEDGELDRKKLASIVFEDESKLKILNSFIHPYVKEYILNEIERLKKVEPNAVVLVESAILFEVSYQEFCDEVWYVNAEDHIRRIRLKKNRNYTDEKIDSILANQMTEEEYKKRSTHVISNNDKEENLIKELQFLLVK